MTADRVVLIVCGLLLAGLTGRVLLDAWLARRRYRRLTDTRPRREEHSK